MECVTIVSKSSLFKQVMLCMALASPVYAAPVVVMESAAVVDHLSSSPIKADAGIVTLLNKDNSPSARWQLMLKDRTIKLGLERWAHKAGWQLVWRSKYDMPIEAEVSIYGTFEYAVNEICRASSNTGKQLFIELYHKNKVMVVYTSADVIQ